MLHDKHFLKWCGFGNRQTDISGVSVCVRHTAYQSPGTSRFWFGVPCEYTPPHTSAKPVVGLVRSPCYCGPFTSVWGSVGLPAFWPELLWDGASVFRPTVLGYLLHSPSVGLSASVATNECDPVN